MFNQVMGESADQPDCEHFGHERPFKPRPLRHDAPISNAKLAIAVDRCGAHQITDLMYHPHRQGAA